MDLVKGWSSVCLLAGLLLTFAEEDEDKKTTTTPQRDMTVSCEDFVENAISHCSCSIVRTSATKRCSYAVGQVTLIYCTVTSDPPTCSKCVFNDYTIGLLGTVDSNLESCSLVEYDKETTTHVLEIAVLAHAELNNMSTFRCVPNCIGGKLSQTVTGIPVEFSDHCADGMYGALCNLTCPSDCKDQLCRRDTGECFEKDSAYTKAYIAAGVGAPALVGVCVAINLWCKRILGCLGLVDEVNMGGDDEGSSTSDPEATENTAPAKRENT